MVTLKKNSVSGGDAGSPGNIWHGGVSNVQLKNLYLNQSNKTGVDYNLQYAKTAIKFVLSVDAKIGLLQIKCKKAGTITNTPWCYSQIWSDSGGFPDALIDQPHPRGAGSFITNSLLTYNNVTASFLEFTHICFLTLSAGPYWLVLYYDSPPYDAPQGGGAWWLDSNNIGSQQVAEWTGSAWQYATDKGIWLKVYTRAQNIYGYNEIDSGVFGESEQSEGVAGKSVDGIGVSAFSKNTIGLQAATEGGTAGLFATADDYYGSILQSKSPTYYAMWSRNLAGGKAGRYDRSGDGVIVDLAKDLSVEGNISVAGAVVSYNGALVSHYFQLNTSQVEEDFKLGHVLVSVDELIPCEAPPDFTDPITKEVHSYSGDLAARQHFPFVDHTTTQADKRVYGVFLGKMAQTADKGDFGENSKAIYQIACMGLGQIRVTDTGGNIEIGDFLQTSTRSGEAEKQPDDIEHNFSFAIARQSVNWAGEVVDPEFGYKWKLIAASLIKG